VTAWETIELPALDAHGRALWPERYDRAALEEIRRDVGEYDWQSLYQQHPVARHGRVFSAFHRVTHVRAHADLERIYRVGGRWSFRRTIVGVDFGMSHPGVMLVAGQTGAGDWVVLHEEVHQHRVFAERHTDGTEGWLTTATRLRADYRPERFVADPSEPGLILALRQHLKGAPVVVNANNDISEGIRRINVALTVRAGGTPGLLVSDGCKNLIRELETWSYLTGSDGKISDTPSDVGDDACDALRYALTSVS
jgi:hypothetical protein